MRDRVITALVLAPTVLAILFLSSPWPLICLGALVAILCALEANVLLPSASKVQPTAYLGFPAAVYLSLTNTPTSLTSAALIVSALLGILCVYLVASGKTKNPIVREAGALWFTAPLAACVVLHGMGAGSNLWSIKSPLLLALLPVWAGDVAGILAGRAFGKHLLAPTLSPKKTVEGGVANLVAAGATGAIFGPLIGLTLGTSIACGIVAGLLGQVGDLFESWVKRRANKKDSGTLLPGHGGILDRIDSLLFTAPAVGLILAFFR